VDEKEVERPELREIQLAVLEADGVVGHGAVLGVPDVVDGHVVPADVGEGQRSHVGLPVAIVGRRDGEPRREDHDERPQDHRGHAPERAYPDQGDGRADRHESGERGAHPRWLERGEVDGQRYPSEQGDT